MGREQKLVIKHTFLEYVSDQSNQTPPTCKPSSGRQRSYTDSPCLNLALDPIYEEVKDLLEGSDSESDAIDLMPSTPEVSPLRCPASHPSYWKDSMPAAALAVPEYAVWPEGQCANQEGWWVPMPYEVNYGYCHGIEPEQFQGQYPAPESTTAPNVHVAESEKAPPAAGVQTYAKVVQNDGTNETRTSVMLKGVPETCTRSTMLQLLDIAGFFGRFNFLYLPMDFKRNKNLGYALINLVSPKEALRLGAYFEGFTCWNMLGGQPCSATWCSPQQGLQAHIDRYRNSPVMHDSVPEEWRPLLLKCGVAVTFPAPTIKIKAPKLKGFA